MGINVFYLSLKPDTPHNGFWDYGIIDLIMPYAEAHVVDTLMECERCVVVVPARSHADLVDEINAELIKIGHCVLFLMGDEEHEFPVEKINHPDIKIWIQNPHPTLHADGVASGKYRIIGTGPSLELLKCGGSRENYERQNDWFFAGQVTHLRRNQAVEALKQLPNGRLVETKSFASGLKPCDYLAEMINSKVIPCPSGPQTVDTFRLFEALEYGCVPIADVETPTEDWSGFWEWLFGEAVPFPQIKTWSDVGDYINEVIKDYPRVNSRVMAFWMRYKNKLREQLLEDLGVKPPLIQAIVPISPIKSHPSLDIIMETIDSLLAHDVYNIIITFDGVRKEQEEMRKSYEEHIFRLLMHLNDLVGGDVIKPYIFDEHMHQVGMMREIVDDITSPVILYVEQDAPLVTDYDIPMTELAKRIEQGEAQVIRFHHEGVIPDEHRVLMLGGVENDLLKTMQWSQRPHLASTVLYKDILTRYFSPDAKCFIEDRLHGIIMDDCLNNGMSGWARWGLYIYHPSGGNIKRSYTTDGRQGAPKYDDTQIW